jgi:single-stranded-DNA-specific exonuclease
MIRVGTQEEKERLFLGFIDGERMVPCKKRGAKGTYEKVAIETIRECTNAKNRQNKTKEEAIERMEIKIHKYGLLENKILFIRLDEEDTFPAELNGLIAMGLSAKYKKPTIVARLNDEGYIRGSARGVNDSEFDDFKQFLLDTELFEYAQGHKQAFGLSIPNKNLTSFHNFANEALKDINFNETCYNVNFQRHATSVDLHPMIMEVGQCDKLWGQKNPQPLIYITDINLTKDDINVCGARKDTLRFEKNGITYIKFFAKDIIKQFEEIEGDIKINIVGKMAINEWNGACTPQVILQDFEIKKDTILDF